MNKTITQKEVFIKSVFRLPSGEPRGTLKEMLWPATRARELSDVPGVSRTNIAFSRVPLHESIETDGDKNSYLITRSEGAELRFPICPEVLEKFEIKMSDSNVLFVVEDKYTIRQDGPKSYTIVIYDPFQDVRAGKISEKGLAGTSIYPIIYGKACDEQRQKDEQKVSTTNDYPILFGTHPDRDDYRVHLAFNSEKVSGGFASVDNGTYFINEHQLGSSSYGMFVINLHGPTSPEFLKVIENIVPK